MPAPSAATFKRLADLIAIPDAATRPTRPVIEAFTGKQLATVPVGTTQDAKDAITRARTAQNELGRPAGCGTVRHLPPLPRPGAAKSRVT